MTEHWTFDVSRAREHGHLNEILSLMATEKEEPAVKSVVSVAKGICINKSCPVEAAKSKSHCSVASLRTRLASDQKSGELTTKEL